MLECLLPALAVAQLAARKTLVSACACSVSLSITTCALCVARLQTRRRWLFVPFPVAHCSSQTDRQLFARLPSLTVRHPSHLPLLSQQSRITHSHSLRNYNTKSFRQQRHCCYSYRHRRLHRSAKALPRLDRPLQTLRAPKYANRTQLERTPTPSESSIVPSNRLDPLPAVKRRRTCHSLISLASGQQPVCHHYRSYALSNRFPDHFVQDCQCYCSTSRHSLGQLDCRAHYR
jgi:hypothetical protein